MSVKSSSARRCESPFEFVLQHRTCHSWLQAHTSRKPFDVSHLGSNVITVANAPAILTLSGMERCEEEREVDRRILHGQLKYVRKFKQVNLTITFIRFRPKMAYNHPSPDPVRFRQSQRRLERCAECIFLRTADPCFSRFCSLRRWCSGSRCMRRMLPLPASR
jgi:hypothetical protein